MQLVMNVYYQFAEVNKLRLDESEQEMSREIQTLPEMRSQQSSFLLWFATSSKAWNFPAILRATQERERKREKSFVFSQINWSITEARVNNTAGDEEGESCGWYWSI